MHTTQEKIIHWLRAAVVFSVVVTPLTAAPPDSGATSSTAANDPAATLLWYQQPAVKWEEALPVGNGRLGAMVFGGTAEERLQLNESTLWGGLPHDYSNPDAGQHLAELRRLIFAGKIPEAEKLGQDADFSKQLAAARRRLPPLQLGKQGQLQEWIGDWDMTAPDQGHRHLSHLYAMMPGQSITPRETPRFAAAVRKSLEMRGDGGMGWSKAWKVGLWARLGEGDRALSMIEGLIKGSTLPSLLDNGPPFQIDGNFGGCAGIGEMLLQSRAAGEASLDDASGKLRGGSVSEATIELLPALPMAWPTGSARGLRARGGFEVDCTWRDGRLTEAAIRSKHGGACRARYRDKMITLDAKAGQNYRLNSELKISNSKS